MNYKLFLSCLLLAHSFFFIYPENHQPICDSNTAYTLIKKDPRNLYWLFNQIRTLCFGEKKIRVESDKISPGWIGDLPVKIRELISHLKKISQLHDAKSDLFEDYDEETWEHSPAAEEWKRLDKEIEGYKNKILNRFLLYGPPGNGKTTMVKQIATLSDCSLKTLNGPSILNKYIGEGAQNIRNFFLEAVEYSKQYGTAVIVFIDEIDAIATKVEDDRIEHRAALQELWLQLDEYKNDPNLIFIGVTNRFEQLDKTFLDRFGSNTIEITNPDYTLRREVTKFYFDKYNIQLDDPLLNLFAKHTNKLSIRCIEDMAQEIGLFVTKHPRELNERLIWSVLKQTKTKFKKNKYAIPSYVYVLSDLSQFTQILVNFVTLQRVGFDVYGYYTNRSK